MKPRTLCIGVNTCDNFPKPLDLSACPGIDGANQAGSLCVVALKQYGSTWLQLVEITDDNYTAISTTLHNRYFIKPIKEHWRPFSKSHERVICVGTIASLLSPTKTALTFDHGFPLPLAIVEEGPVAKHLTDALRDPCQHTKWPDSVMHEDVRRIAIALQDQQKIPAIIIRWS